MNQLERDFIARIRFLIAEGYQLNPPYTAREFVEMIERHGAVEATPLVIMSLSTRKAPHGFTRLWSLVAST